jgi:hypothetical protein
MVMQRTEKSELALRGASKGAQTAFDAIQSKDLADVPMDEKIAWAMAAAIHCDVCRLVVAYEECEREGLARLLWMADICSKLYEAKNCAFKIGSRSLCEIGKRKSCGAEPVGRKLKELKALYPISNVEAYAVYRNKFGYHYDADALNYIIKFGNEDAEDFFAMLTTFVLFSREWAGLTKALIRDEFACEERR